MNEHTAVILGAGQMGLVIADLLAGSGATVRLWGRSSESAANLAATRRSDRLRDFVLPDSIHVTADDAEALADATIIVSAIPTQHMRAMWERLRPFVPRGTPAVSMAKGIETKTLLRPTEIIEAVLDEHGGGTSSSTCVVSGPAIAQELAHHLPATMVASSNDSELAKLVQQLFSNGTWMRIYTHEDPLGVELAGATKNIIALAAGIVDGLEAGYNAKSALLARGLAEVARLGVAMGANRETFFGVAGVGDLATTCFCPMGRNRTCGERIGRGETLEQILQTTESVVEGVPTTRAVVELARRHDVEMPLTAAVHAILFEGLSPGDAIAALMQRTHKPERVG